MFSAEELAAAPRRYALRSDGARAMSGSQLESWAKWVAAPKRSIATAFAPEQLWVALAARPAPRGRGRLPQHSRWEAFRSLFASNWGSEDDGNGRLRFWSAVASVLINLFFAAMLLWLMYLRFIGKPPEEEESAMLVQMIGKGAPSEEGGGTPMPQPEVTSAMQGAAAPAARAESTGTPGGATLPQTMAQTLRQPVAMEAPALPQFEGPPQPPTPVAPAPPAPAPPPAPIMVAKRAERIPEFQTPPPKQVTLPPDLVVQRPELQERAIPAPPVPTPPVPAPAAPATASAPVVVPRVASRAEAMPQLSTASTARSSDLSSQVRALPDIAPPAPMPGTGAATPSTAATTDIGNAGASTPATSGSPLQGTAASTGAPSPTRGAGTGVQSNGQGVGTSTQARTGGAQTGLKDDDWGSSNRNALGQPRGSTAGNPRGTGSGDGGLFNKDGSVRLGDAFVVRIKDPYKDGSWMKRPVRKNETTMFEPYWVPHETLLQEWVRKGIKEIEIPLDGNGRRVIKCKVSLLQLGGGCGLAGGINGVQDNPARARKPPDVPFKSKYFEDQGALGPPKPADSTPLATPRP